MSDTERPKARGLTIDGPFSKDLDDAIWLEPHGEGWLVQVSIADVSSMVEIGSELDLQARQQACTRYFATHNEPMLPHEFSEDALSLLPKKARPTVTVTMLLSEELEVVEMSVARTTLTSSAKMHYDLVDAIIRGNLDDEARDMLIHCNNVSDALLKKRRQGGALAVYDIFSGWVTTEEGFLKKVIPEDRHLANIIVQEFMILANQAVARFLAERDIPVLFRNHTAKAIGTDRQSVLTDLANSVAYPEKFPITALQSRVSLVLNRATYDAFLQGHFGLNLPAYLHFTSPIRRYADLVNHRILLAHLEGGPSPYTREALAEVGQHLTAVDHELKDKRSQSFKDADKGKTGRKIERGIFERLTPDDFHKVIKLAARGDRMTPELQVSIIDRTTHGKLLPRDIYFLLFEANQANQQPAWLEIKREAFQWIAARPEHAMSLFNQASQEKIASVPQFSLSSSGPSHAMVFTGTGSADYCGQQVTSERCTAATKKLAQQLICVSLIHRVLTMMQKVEGIKWEPPVSYSGNASATQVGPGAESAAEVAASTNPKNALLELCQKHQWSMPEFTAVSSGPDHSKTFSVTATLRIGGREVRSDECKSASKKDAEKLAAGNLLQKLGPFVQKAAPAQAPLDEHGNFVSTLQERLTALRKPFPDYTFNQEGPSHTPTITCTGKLDLGGGRVITKTAKAPNNKAAKQKVAALLFEEVNK